MNQSRSTQGDICQFPREFIKCFSGTGTTCVVVQTLTGPALWFNGVIVSAKINFRAIERETQIKQTKQNNGSTKTRNLVMEHLILKQG
jgi:hypothetical protein